MKMSGCHILYIKCQSFDCDCQSICALSVSLVRSPHGHVYASLCVSVILTADVTECCRDKNNIHANFIFGLWMLECWNVGMLISGVLEIHDKLVELFWDSLQKMFHFSVVVVVVVVIGTFQSEFRMEKGAFGKASKTICVSDANGIMGLSSRWSNPIWLSNDTFVGLRMIWCETHAHTHTYTDTWFPVCGGILR